MKTLKKLLGACQRVATFFLQKRKTEGSLRLFLFALPYHKFNSFQKKRSDSSIKHGLIRLTTNAAKRVIFSWQVCIIIYRWEKMAMSTTEINVSETMDKLLYKSIFKQ